MITTYLAKRVRSFAGMALAASLLFTACRKENTKPGGGDNNGEKPKGQVTQVGTPDGPLQQKTIGAAGGSISSADNKLTIEFPAGALVSETAISIQPITNFCPGAAGQAYRITPHLELAKPATITFQYNDKEIEGSDAALLAVAYQNEQKSWQTARIVAKDSANKKITISTTHFSDWSLFRSLELIPLEPKVNTGGSITLTVRRMVPAIHPDELAVPVPGNFLTAQEAANEIRDWRVIGDGVIAPDGAKGVYTAPATVPNRNPVVNVRLKNTPGNMELILVSQITVLGEGVTWRVDGGAWKTGRSLQGAVNAGGVISMLIHADAPSTETIQVIWNHTGTFSAEFPWNTNGLPTFNYTAGGPNYLHLYPVGNHVAASPGSLKITECDARPGGFVAGTFLLEKAAKYNTCPTCPATTHKIEGKFRVKWGG